MRSHRCGVVAVACAALGGSASCLPTDTKPAAGSVLLSLVPGEASFTTVDGWSIAVDRLFLGIGDGSVSFGSDCIRYSESRYMRLLDARLPTEQKVNLIFGFGTCYLDFRVQPPDPNALLGEGVSETDKTSMQGDQGPTGQPSNGIAVDFAATATRGTETKRLRWAFRQILPYTGCGTRLGAGARPLQLRSDENLTLRITPRASMLFGDESDPATAVPRFDPIAGADTLVGNDDDEVTLAELGQVPMDVARQFGPYGVGEMAREPRSLREYVSLVLRQLLGFDGEIVCNTLRLGPP